MANTPSLKTIAELVDVFPEEYRDAFTEQIQSLYEEYLAVMTAEQRNAITRMMERKVRNQERGRRAANTRATRQHHYMVNDMVNDGLPSIQDQLNFYSTEEFSEAGIRRKFEGYDEEFIQARIAENETRREELQRQMNPMNRRR